MPFCSLCTLILGLKGCCNKAYASPSQKRPAEAWEEKERPSVGQVGSARVWTSSLARTYGDVNPHVAAGPAIGHHPGLLLLPSLTPAPSFFFCCPVFSNYDGEFRLPLVLSQGSPFFHSRCEGEQGIALEYIRYCRRILYHLSHQGNPHYIDIDAVGVRNGEEA